MILSFIAWPVSFAKKVYIFIPLLPAVEKYCLANQMRRAAISVSNNIAEGHGRWYFLENIRFCRIARGSVDELIDDFNICEDQIYCDPATIADLKIDAYDLIHRINGYIAYLRKSNQGNIS